MSEPYKECAKCLAKPFCKVYTGEVAPSSIGWCTPKYRLDKALALSNIPKRYLKANIHNFVVDEDNEYVYNGLKPYVDNIVAEVDDEGTNFFLWNEGAGTGKTFAGVVLLNQYIYKTCGTSKFDFENPLALFVSYSDLMDDLRYRRDSDEVQQKLKMVREVPFLMLDDIGAGTTSRFTAEQTYLIINERFNAQRATIFTSNLSSKQLADEEVLGQRSVSRILSECVGFQVEGKDRRPATVKEVIKRAR